VPPKSLIIGTAIRPSIAEIHPALANTGRVDDLPRNMLKGRSTLASLEMVATYEDQLGVDLIRSLSLARMDGHISMQTDFMIDRTREIEGSMQTDSVHSMFLPHVFRELNVTFTSRYCTVIKRTIPLVISVMFGKTVNRAIIQSAGPLECGRWIRISNGGKRRY